MTLEEDTNEGFRGGILSGLGSLAAKPKASTQKNKGGDTPPAPIDYNALYITLSVLLVIANIILFSTYSLTPYILTVELFTILFLVFTIISREYQSLHTSAPNSVMILLNARNQTLGKSIDTLAPNITSVSNGILTKTVPYNHATINDSNITLLNWAPLTVRLAGYLGGLTSVSNGVFDMANGIKYALHLGARSFIFDIDYLDTAPCQPVLIHRNVSKTKVSINTGSIRDGMQALNDKAFTNNYDPVIIVLYLHDIPDGKKQRESFFTAIANAMKPISANHLGLTDGGNFHNCGSESIVFTSNITDFQKKFIVICNYDTTQIPKKSNPKDNLHFWVNARLWQNINSSSTIGSVTTTAPAGTNIYATVGSTSDFLSLTTTARSSFPSTNNNIYTIALGPVEETLSMANVTVLLVALGIQSIPMDVIRLGEHPNHTAALAAAARIRPLSLNAIVAPPNLTDQLGYWIWAGYYRFNTA